MRLRIYLILPLAFLFIFSFLNSVVAQNQRLTMDQIQLLLQEKNSRTPIQKKIDSKLLQAVREKRGQKMAEGVNLQAVDVNANANGNLKVDISANVTDALIDKIESAGGKIIFSSWQYNSIRATINLADVEKIAAFAEVKFIEPAVLAMTVGSGNPDKKLSTKKVTLPDFISSARSSKPTFEERAKNVRIKLQNYLAKFQSPELKENNFTGSVNSEGDRTHRADDVRSTYGYAGQGIKIGVISDSYNSTGGASADVLNGNLPGTGNPVGNTTPVTVLADISNGSDEGRAMLQIVHDLAPKAQLYFATAFISEASFASNILALRNAPNNCDIIIDDIFYYDEPSFQDGIVAQSVNTVTAAGAFYFSSAGNEGNLVKGTSGIFEGDFNDAGSAAFTPSGTKTGTIHNFGTVASPINGDIISSLASASGTNTYTLTWADPMGTSTNDYDLFLVSSAGAIKASSTNIQSGTQNPFEIIQISGSTILSGDRLIVFKTTAATSLAFNINTFRGRLTVATNGQTHGHSAAINAFSVAATPAVSPGPYPAAFSISNQVESFTSDGPRRMFFNADGTAITPGNFLFATSGGNVRQKPDITAADGVTTTLTLNGGLNPFYGTSAAAPHAGAIAALLKSANASLTLSQLRTILTSTALDIESTGYDNISGSGIVQAFQAMQAMSPTPMASLNVGTVVATDGTGSNNNGIIEPGESGKITVQLSNPSLVNATSVNAVLTTSTPGVTITQGTASYGSIAASGNATNTAVPFVISVANTVTCGTIINLALNVTYSGGSYSPQGFQFTTTVGAQPFNFSTTLDVTPPSSGTGYTATTGQQTGRISRSAVTPTCGSPKANPGLTTTVGARQYDAYTFTNTSNSSQCVTVTLASSNSFNLYSAAYTGSFVPSNPSTNFLADQGSSATTPIPFSFTVGVNATFVVVVHDVNVTPASNSPYTLSVSLANCSASGPTWVGNTSNDWNTATNWSTNTVPTINDNQVTIPTGGKNMPVLLTTTQPVYNLSVQTGASINITGTLQVASTLMNSGVISGSGTTVLNGTINQNLAGIGTISNVTINNGNGASISPTNNSVSVTGALNFTTGSLITNGNLTLKSSAAGTASIGPINTGLTTISGNVTIERYMSNRRAWRLLGMPFSSTSQTIKSAWMEGAASLSSDPNPGFGTQITTFTGDANAANFDAQKPASSIRTYSAENFNSDAAHTPNTTATLTANPSYFLFVRGDRSVDRTTGGSATSSTILRATGLVRLGSLTTGITSTNFSLIPNIYPSPIDFDAIKAISTNAAITKFYVWDAALGTTGNYRTVDISGSAPNYTYTSTPSGGSSAINNNWRFIESGTSFFVPGSTTVLFTESMKTANIPPSTLLRTSNTSETQLLVNLKSVNTDNTTTLSDGVRLVFDNIYSAAVDKEDAKKITSFDLNFGIENNSEVLSIDKRPLPKQDDIIPLKLWGVTPGNYQFEILPANFSSDLPYAYVYDAYLKVYSTINIKDQTIMNFSITSDAASAAANRFSLVFSKIQLNVPSIVIYPNPVQNGFVKLQMNNMPKGDYSVRLVNNLGQTIMTKQINHVEGTSVETINTNKIKGAYILEIVKPDNTKSINKLIIN